MKKLSRHTLRFMLAMVFSAISLSLHAQFNTDRITAIGRNALYFEDYVLSIQYFNQVIRVKPYLAEPYQLRAIAKVQLGDYQGALSDVDRAIRLNPFQHYYYYTRGFIYAQTDSLGLAESDFTHALALSPEKRSYLLMRADVRARRQEYDSAMVDIEFLLSRDPHSPSLLFEKGSISLNRKDTIGAAEAFALSAKYDTQNYRVRSAQGMVALMQGDNESAIHHYSEAVRLGSEWSGDYTNRGLAYYRQHNYRAALADYDQAIVLDSHDARTYFNRAMIRHELGDNNRALEDYTTAIDLAPEATEYRYQRGMLLMQLGKWSDARADFDAMIARYPSFVPSYYLAAQACDKQNKTKDAFRYRKTANDLEQNAHATTPAPNTGAQAAAQAQSKNPRKEFSARTAQAHDDWETGSNGATDARGAIQNRYQDVVNCPNVVLSYYDNTSSIRRTPYSHLLVEQINRNRVLPSILHFTTNELALTAEMVNLHFAQISRLTEEIDALRGTRHPRLPDLFFARAIEAALVQDYVSAIEDVTNAILLRPEDKNIIQTFCRANWRFKLLEYMRSTGELTAAGAIDFEIMLRDYDYIINEQPDFVYAAYNKANMLCMQKNFDDAIEHYSMAIEQDGDFAEAYYNRGLTYIYTDRNELGLADLSHAGELGIYQAYNLLTRFR